MDWLSLDMRTPVSLGDVAIRMSLASLLGACVGWDREAQNKAAGLRTHMLVSLGAAVFTLTALQMFELTATQGDGRGDPTRLLQGLVSGIGFLGAGQIIQSRGSVVGITTAAGIWVVGAIGVACGGGSHAIAVLTVAFVLVILRGIVYLEGRLGSQPAADPDARAARSRRTR
jgi:putative Mg2+ transporter-C (MgtC) family protein